MKPNEPVERIVCPCGKRHVTRRAATPAPVLEANMEKFGGWRQVDGVWRCGACTGIRGKRSPPGREA